MDVARWDLIVRFKDDDVPDEEIARHRPKEPPIPLDVLKKHVFWAWSLTPDQVRFTEEAERAVDEAFSELVQFSHTALPLIHRGYKETIARVAAAYAVLRHSVRVEQVKQFSSSRGEGVGVYVVVEPEHVRWAADFLWRLAELWDYPEYVMKLRREEEISDDEYALLKGLLEEDEVLERVFEAIVEKNGITCRVLAKKLNVSQPTVIDRTSVLRSHGLVDAHERRPGYWLTAKGARFARKLLMENTPHPSPKKLLNCSNCSTRQPEEVDE